MVVDNDTTMKSEEKRKFNFLDVIVSWGPNKRTYTFLGNKGLKRPPMVSRPPMTSWPQMASWPQIASWPSMTSWPPMAS